MKNGDFRIRRVRLKQHGFAYETFELTGYLAGQRIRNRFKTRELAVGEKTRLEVKVVNGAGEVRAVVTRLWELQVRTAETLFALTPDPLAAVQWYLANFPTSAAEMMVETATAQFLADRTPHIGPGALRDYTRTLGLPHRSNRGLFSNTCGSHLPIAAPECVGVAATETPVAPPLTRAIWRAVAARSPTGRVIILREHRGGRIVRQHLH